MVVRDVCPRCQSPKYKKNGHIHNSKQNHHCHDCGRQFVQCFEQYLISDDKRGLIERLLVERISLRGICRAVGIKLKWLLGFLVQCVKALPDHLHVQPITCHGHVLLRRLEVEADEMAHIPSDLVVKRVTVHRKPPEVRICRLRHQSAVGTRPPSTSTPHWPACWARR